MIINKTFIVLLQGIYIHITDYLRTLDYKDFEYFCILEWFIEY